MNGITYETFIYICYGAAALSAILLITSVILFFVLKIPHVIGDLSGANARKAIAQIRDQNEAGGPKAYHPSAVNQERGKITDKISGSGRLLRYPSSRLAGHGTTKLNTEHLTAQASNDQPLPPQEVYGDGQTDVLDPSGQTTLLDQDSQTTLLDQGGQTTLLSEQTVVQQVVPCVFSVDFEITYIHTSEQII